jgi:large subunit ribosomal protein L23
MILAPKISEKALFLSERGQYIFEVPMSANKIEVARSVEAAFKVTVTSVNMQIAKGKIKLFQRKPGKRVDVKKAIVTLKKGQTIALFEGVK